MPEKTPAVDAYLSELAPDRRAALERIRSLIFETVPRVTETMKYRMPTYELDEVVCAVASQKHYVSLFMDVSLVAKYEQQLQHLDVGKSCIRFKRIGDLPLDIVRQILEETVLAQSVGAQPGAAN
jgi:uncharacterized protein YdhG (YjbR/CyaY superfamily)